MIVVLILIYCMSGVYKKKTRNLNCKHKQTPKKMSSRPELKFPDQAEERGFYRGFKQLASDPQVVKVVDKGEYYTALDQDARFIAENIYHTNSVLKQSQGLDYVTMSHAVFANLLSLALLERGLKVEIYDKNWKLVDFASPGNIENVEHLLNISDINTGLVVVSLKIVNKAEGKVIGFCFVDTLNKKMGISEFIDNELYSNLESLLIQIDAKECLVGAPSNEKDPDYLKLIGIIDRCGVSITTVKNSEFNSKDVEQDLNRLLENELALTTGDLSTSTNGLASAHALINYLSLLADESNYGKFQIMSYSLDKYMKLDSSAVKALNLFPQSKTLNGSKNSNIFDLLNHCKSSGGSRLLNQWLKQPLVSKLEIEKRQSLVELMINDVQLRASLQDEFLNSIPDLRKLNKKLQYKNSNGNSSLDDVIRIYQFLVKLPIVIELLENKLGELDSDENLKELISTNWLEPILGNHNALLKFQELIETTVDLSRLDSHQYIIKPDYDPLLQEYKQRLDEIETKIREIHSEVSAELNLDPEKKLKLELHHVHGWCMRLTRTEERSIRGQSKFIELQTVKAGVFFTTSEMREISRESAELQDKYNKQQNHVVKEIVSIASTYASVLDDISLVLSHLDVIVAMAHISSYAPIQYTKPKLYELDDPNRRCILKESRHPCVEMQDDIRFIANDIELISNEIEFLIITGPNMGGKSTFIRQIGSIAILAQIGCFIPANEGAEIPIFDSILSRVGAGDSQLKGVSTFMVEMLETSSILKSATSNSLIIIDELGRGTSTYDGFGLAWAISEFIIKKIKCFTMFATHFHELTKIAELYPTVKNLHVVAHIEQHTNGDKEETEDDITLLYKVEPGISDQSFGINVAEIVKFPQKIISMAKRKAAELEENISEKRVKCSDEEIVKGEEILKNVLKRWKDSVNLDETPNEEAVAKLKQLIASPEFQGDIESNEFIKQVLSL